MKKQPLYIYCKNFLALCLCIIGISSSAQTEGHLSKYMFSGIILNPAQAGSHSAFNALLFTRLQWTNFEGAPNTYTFAVDGLLPNDRMGLGLHGSYERIGLQDAVSLHASYSYQLTLNDLDDRLNFGVSAGFSQYSFQTVDMHVRDINGNLIYDPTDNIILSNKPLWIPDFGLGVYYDKENFAGGLSMVNMGGFFSDSKVPTAQLFATGYIPTSRLITLKPALLLKKTTDMMPLISDFHVAAIFLDRFSFGISYRMGIPFAKSLIVQHAMSFVAQVYVFEKLRIGYAFDLLLGRTALYRNGSHEVSIGYTLNRTVRRKLSPRIF